MTRIIVNQTLEPGAQISVEGDELHYLTRVRRHCPGDQIEVRDLDGNRFMGSIDDIKSKCAFVSLKNQLPKIKTIWPVEMAVAVPKRSLMDDIVRKLNELGVRRLIPTITARSVVQPGSAKVDRWRRIASESTRQCGREKPLIVEDICAFDQVAADFDGNTKLILHPNAARGFTQISPPSQTCVNLLIGPEGGFTTAEATFAQNRGFALVGLGNSILRVETATLTAAVLSISILGGFEVFD